MKRLVLTIFCLAIMILPAFSWSWRKSPDASLILSSNPNLTSSTMNIFRAGDRIYFRVDSKKGFKSNYIKYQIVMQNENAFDGGYTRYRNVTKKVTDKNTFSDYFVIHQAGQYYIQIFDIENLQQWIAFAGFKVVE